MFLQIFFLEISDQSTQIDWKDVFTSWSICLNVLGNIFGKSFKKIGKVNSINGTMINTENGTSRNRSTTVRVN